VNPRHIGDRLVWGVRSNDLTHWTTRNLFFCCMFLLDYIVYYYYILFILDYRYIVYFFVVIWIFGVLCHFQQYFSYIMETYNKKKRSRVVQWVRSLDLTAHTNLSPIWRGFASDFVNWSPWYCWKWHKTPKILCYGGFCPVPLKSTIILFFQVGLCREVCLGWEGPYKGGTTVCLCLITLCIFLL
jgi:hypothetical protein